jgi:hypothetical protein
VIEYDGPEKAALPPPIPLLLDTLDKQQAIVTEAVHRLAEQLDTVLRPVDTMSAVPQERNQEALGGSNLATRLQQVSSSLGDLGVYLNQLMVRLEL